MGKATIGTIPFVYFGAQWGGVYGVLVGQVIGAIIFAILGVYTAFRLVDKVRADASKELASTVSDEQDEFDTELSPSSTNALSSSCALMAQITEEQDAEAGSEVREFIKPTGDKAS